jgi:tRNA-dihydrouridine synthase B
MAGFTDLAFRSIALDHGADFAFTEMISAEAIRRGNQKTFRLAATAPNESSFGIQIFAGSAEAAAAAIGALAPFRPALFDLNCGCSVPKIIKSGAGAQLLQTPEKIGEIIAAMAGASSIPVSVKLRLGWDAASHTYRQAADAAVRAGACIVTLHPRTRAQGFSGQAEWSHIKALKDNLGLPVIGSGDLFRPEDAVRMLSTTGCDGVMFARGAIGNPFIFEDTKALLAHGRPAAPHTPEEKLEVAFRHLKLLATFKTELIAAREMRKHIAQYAAGIDHAVVLRRVVNKAVTVSGYEDIIDRFLAGKLTED